MAVRARRAVNVRLLGSKLDELVGRLAVPVVRKPELVQVPAQ